MQWFRRIVAVLVSMLVAGLLIAGLEGLGKVFFPPPQGLNWQDAEQIELYMQGMPVTTLLFVLAGWLLGTYCGGLVASLIGRGHVIFYCCLIGGLVLLCAASTLFLLPHPWWFVALALLGIPLATWLAIRRMQRFFAREVPPD